MKFLSGAFLFFVLMGSTLLAFDQAGKEPPATSRNPLMDQLSGASFSLPALSNANRVEPISTKNRTAPERNFMKLLVET